MDNKRVYLDKESLTQKKLQEYINFLYSEDYKNILEGVGSLHQEGLWSSKQSEIIQ